MSQNVLNFGGLAPREVIFVNTGASEIGFRLGTLSTISG
jgi:hypothetical protein